ncbi:MAG TPA: hypothetical protein VL985_11365 [Stellaceae bacterium]|nr:hypothetical protein [Stellaceae bacterium]
MPAPKNECFGKLMLIFAFVVLCAAVLIGAPLALVPQPPHRALPVLHGAAGAASLGILVAAITHSSTRAAMGTAGFDRISAALLGGTLLLGLLIAARGWRGRRPNAALIGAHASVAVAGLTLLLAVIALG